MVSAFEQKMTEAGLHPGVIKNFIHYYNQYKSGKSSYISKDEIEPVNDLLSLKELLEYEQIGIENLQKLAIIRLGGGTGTSMGVNGAKSLIKAINYQPFIQILAMQVLKINEKYGVHLPLTFLTSEVTDETMVTALKSFGLPHQDLPKTLIQNKFPKVSIADDGPINWPDDPSKEWAPPGHGDIYQVLSTSGMLDEMLSHGYEYVLVSNMDNINGTVDERILGYMVEENKTFLMEVARRTEVDKKGGHLAKTKDGKLLLREIAQCPPDEIEDFQNYRKYKYFNANTLWFHIPTLKKVLEEHEGIIDLPLITNKKHVDPTDETSPEVYQFETAMGTAITNFPGATAIQVSRSRFMPVKKTSDLILLWSDVYSLNEEYKLIKDMADDYMDPPVIDLDQNYYKFIEDMESRFPYGAPSLRSCTRFSIKGDVKFGKNIKCVGNVSIINNSNERKYINDDSVLMGTVEL